MWFCVAWMEILRVPKRISVFEAQRHLTTPLFAPDQAVSATANQAKKLCFAGEKPAICWNEMSTNSPPAPPSAVKGGCGLFLKPREYEAVVARIADRMLFVKRIFEFFGGFPGFS